MLLKVGQYLDHGDVMKFECGPFSCHSAERETLFFGGDTVLRIKGVVQWVGDDLLSYDEFMEPINAFCRMINGLSVKGQPVSTKNRYKIKMKMLIKDLLRSLLLWHDAVECPKYIYDLVRFHHESSASIEFVYDELRTEYEWMAAVLRKEWSDDLSVVNLCSLFCHCEEVTFMLEGLRVFSSSECRMLCRDLLSISKMGLAMTIRFQWRAGTVPQAARSVLNQHIMRTLADTEWNVWYDANAVSFKHDAVLNYNARVKAQSHFIGRIKYILRLASQDEANRQIVLSQYAQSAQTAQIKPAKQSTTKLVATQRPKRVIPKKSDFEVVMISDSDSSVASQCKNRRHVHLREDQCRLLVFGFIREFEFDDESEYEIADDLYAECWAQFRRITMWNKEQFETGDFYRGYECTIDALGIKSVTSKTSIHLQVVFQFDDQVLEQDNRMMADVRWIWLDFKGKEKEYTYKDQGQLSRARPTFWQQTYVTHPWKLFNGKHFLGVYVPTSQHPLHIVRLSDDWRQEKALLMSFEKGNVPKRKRKK